MTLLSGSMAFLCALGQVQSNRPPIVPMPGRGQSVQIECLVPTDKVPKHRRWLIELICRTIPQGTENFAANQMKRVVKDWRPPTVLLNSDHVRIGFSIDEDDLSEGYSLLESILLRPTLLKSELDKSIDQAFRNSEDPWESVELKRDSAVYAITTEDARSFWRWFISNSTPTIHVFSQLPESSLNSRWNSRPVTWPAPVRQEPYVRERRITPPMVKTAGVESVPTRLLPKSDPNLAAVFVGLSILGHGKESLLFRTVREQLQMTYRQEALLSAAPEGWVIRVKWGGEARADKAAIKTAMLTAIANLTDADIARATKLLESGIKGVIPLSYLQVGPEDQETGLIGSPAWTSYWRFKTGKDWNEETFLQHAQMARLDEMKELLSSWIEKL